MMFKGKFLSISVLALGLAGAALAQDTKTTTTPDATGKDAAKAQKKFEKRAGREFGRFEGRGFGGRMGDFGGRMGHVEGFGPGITLTDAQKAQIKQIHEANKPDPAVFEELRTIQQARRTGTLTDAQKARVKELREQQAAKAKSVRDQIEAVLTPEQKAQLQKNQEERKARRQQMEQRMQEWRKNHQTKPDAKAAPTKPITE